MSVWEGDLFCLGIDQILDLLGPLLVHEFRLMCYSTGTL